MLFGTTFVSTILKKIHNFMKKTILSISLIAVLALGTTFAQTTKKKTTTKKSNTTKKTTTTTTKPSTTNSLTTTPAKTNNLNVGTTATQVLNTATSALGIGSLSDGDIVSGLKEALSIGANNSAIQLNALDGFNKNQLIRIPFPKDAIMVAQKLRQLGFGSKVDAFETSLNRAAETASKEAAPIFVNAITSMSISDAKNILTGQNNAATTYLQSSTRTQLFSSFSPIVGKAISSASVTKYWDELANIYNKLPLVSKVNPNLTEYTTNKALDGLFTVLAGEELKIRQDPSARVSDILKKVFGAK